MVETPSSTPPLFQSSAQEILSRLEGDESEDAGALRAEASELLKIFQEWADHRPTDPSRIDTLNRLFGLYRRTMDYIVRRR